MKKSIHLFITLLLLVSCKTLNKATKNSEESSTIVYILPTSVEQLLENEISKDSNNVYMELWTNNDTCRIFLNHFDEKIGLLWVKKSNRKLFLNGSLYPLIFDHDRSFAITDNVEELRKKIKIEKYPLLTRKLPIQHAAYYIIFTKNGKIIENGYDGVMLKSQPSKN
jgi:hypothetical protein